MLELAVLFMHMDFQKASNKFYNDWTVKLSFYNFLKNLDNSPFFFFFKVRDGDDVFAKTLSQKNLKFSFQFNCSVMSDSLPTPCTAANPASLCITNSRSLLKLVPVELVIPSISSSVVPFSSCLQSFPASGSL